MRFSQNNQPPEFLEVLLNHSQMTMVWQKQNPEYFCFPMFWLKQCPQPQLSPECWLYFIVVVKRHTHSVTT